MSYTRVSQDQTTTVIAPGHNTIMKLGASQCDRDMHVASCSPSCRFHMYTIAGQELAEPQGQAVRAGNRCSERLGEATMTSSHNNYSDNNNKLSSAPRLIELHMKPSPYSLHEKIYSCSPCMHFGVQKEVCLSVTVASTCDPACLLAAARRLGKRRSSEWLGTHSA